MQPVPCVQAPDTAPGPQHEPALHALRIQCYLILHPKTRLFNIKVLERKLHHQKIVIYQICQRIIQLILPFPSCYFLSSPPLHLHNTHTQRHMCHLYTQEDMKMFHKKYAELRCIIYGEPLSDPSPPILLDFCNCKIDRARQIPNFLSGRII